MRKTRVFKIVANVCRLILACTFIVSGFTKVIDCLLYTSDAADD